jgi:hypothetical protein
MAGAIGTECCGRFYSTANSAVLAKLIAADGTNCLGDPGSHSCQDAGNQFIVEYSCLP